MKNLPENIQVISDRVECYRELKDNLKDLKIFLYKNTPKELRLVNSNYDNVDIDKEYLYMFIDTLEAYGDHLENDIQDLENKFDNYIKGE